MGRLSGGGSAGSNPCWGRFVDQGHAPRTFPRKRPAQLRTASPWCGLTVLNVRTGPDQDRTCHQVADWSELRYGTVNG
jgi:hypothetical protein